MQAAGELAESGIAVDLVTASPFFHQPRPTKGAKNSESARLLSLAKHPRIKMWTGSQLTRVEEGPDGLSVALQRQPRYVDLSKCTACGDCIEACPVTVGELDRKAIFLPDGSQPGCVAIDKRGTAPCTNACPGGIPVQGYVALIARGRFREAFDLIEAAIPFPGICGRICTHPCEVNCRRNAVDSPVAIRALKRFVADWAVAHPRSDEAPPTAAAPDAQKVAVVGSGPAGMTAALELIRRGYRVTVFEKLPVVAGMMSIGIPSYRLPREVIEREYRRIIDLGADIRLNTTIGPGGDHSLEELFRMGFDAVCLAVGAHRSLKLNIPGEDLAGVVHGIELLKQISLSRQPGLSAGRTFIERVLSRGTETRALVLGGGNTAMDVSRSLRRLGLQAVRIVYRRSREEMPAMPEEIADAEAEGVAIDFLTAPLEILGNTDTGVTGLKCLRMRLGEPDAGGRRRPLPVEGSDFALAADLVVLAIGQTPDLSVDSGLAVNRMGRIQVDESGSATSRAGVFAAGDAVTHDRMAVIEAIGMGKKAAAAISAYLCGDRGASARGTAERLPEVVKDLTDQDRAPVARISPPKADPADAAGTFAEVELGFDAAQAKAEAARCLNCGPCSECMACVQACKPGAVIHTEQPTRARIRPGAVIFARDAAAGDLDRFDGVDRLHIVKPDDPGAASAAVADLVAALPGASSIIMGTGGRQSDNGAARIGVFVCRCMDQISETIDTADICRRASRWQGVVSARELPISCSPEGAAEIRSAIAAERLNRAVLAACSCCTINQVCFSCTFQRVRCKQNLGVLPVGDPAVAAARLDGTDMGLDAGKFEFVNIREQCAWVHKDDPAAATAKAAAMVEAATARANLPAAALRPDLNFSGALTAMVDPDRCRACYTCVATCDLDAVTVNGSGARPHARVDPDLCNGCGSCAARCPSNAIDTAAASDRQIEAMITVLLK
jgi:NADPH-dependent glutamate synthase beta subunit-like oxidoreductase/NAD-dependent dihydropyrimidine dehydrogenase PreA subunit